MRKESTKGSLRSSVSPSEPSIRIKERCQYKGGAKVIRGAIFTLEWWSASGFRWNASLLASALKKKKKSRWLVMTGPSSRGHGRRRRTHPYCVCQENRWGSGWSDQREWQRRFQLLPSGCWSQSPPHPETFRAETGKNPRVHANMELKSLGHGRGVPRAAIPMRQQRRSSLGIRATNISSCLSDEATINSLSSYFVKLQCLLRNY